MNNNKNKELIDKLEREIWLFQQWLAAMESESGSESGGKLNDTQTRIQTAYQECIVAREKELHQLLQGEEPAADIQEARAAVILSDA